MVVDNELEVLKGLLKKTFSNIKTDISVNSKEIERLFERNRQLEVQFMQSQNEIQSLKGELQAIKGTLTKAQEEHHKKFGVMADHNQAMESFKLAQKLANIEKKLDQQIMPIQKTPEKGLTAQVMRKVSRNKKSLIKRRIIEIATNEELSLSELKEIVVDEQGLCSKATFYRYFDDLKKKGKLSLVIVDEINMVVPVKTETRLS